MTEEVKQCENNVCQPELPQVVQEVKPVVVGETKIKRTDHLFKPGNPGGGRRPDTPEQIIEKKAIRQLVNEYKKDLADALPLISPVLIKKAIRGDLGSIKEINEVLIDKPKQKQQGGDTINNLILVKFIDGKTDDNRNTEGV